MEKSLVSIVISSYNHGRYLAESIDSALRQNDANVEVIVVDDGSTDTSREIIRSYRSTICPIFQRNGGQASAWNTGAALARGSWVVFLDSDDRLVEHAAAAIVACGADRPAPSKIHWRMRLIGERGEPMGIDIPDGPLPTGNRLPELLEFGFDRGPNLPSSANAWRASFLDRVLPIPEPPFRISADTFLLGLSPLFGDTAAVDAICSEYRSHQGNNGAKGSVQERAADVVRRSSLVFSFVGAELTRRGFVVDPSTWKKTNPVFVRYSRLASPTAASWCTPIRVDH
jgi:glycosyltransferase involved in cell wall biosynthesis